MHKASCTTSPPFARTWVVSCIGTRPRKRGTVPVTVLGFGEQAKCSPVPPSRRSKRRPSNKRPSNRRPVSKRPPNSRVESTPEAKNGRVRVRSPEKQVDDQTSGDLAERDSVSAVSEREVFVRTSRLCSDKGQTVGRFAE